MIQDKLNNIKEAAENYKKSLEKCEND